MVSITAEKHGFEMLPYTCFSINSEGIALDGIQDILRWVFLTRRLNPPYVFVSKQDQDLFMYDGKPLAMVTNQTTGRYIRIVTLPDCEPGTLIFGFFKY